MRIFSPPAVWVYELHLFVRTGDFGSAEAQAVEIVDSQELTRRKSDFESFSPPRVWVYELNMFVRTGQWRPPRSRVRNRQSRSDGGFWRRFAGPLTAPRNRGRGGHPRK